MTTAGSRPAGISRAIARLRVATLASVPRRKWGNKRAERPVATEKGTPDSTIRLLHFQVCGLILLSVKVMM